MLAKVVVWLGIRLPANLSIFLAGILVSNAVNVFTGIFASETATHRTPVLLISGVTALLAAALWTAVAGKQTAIDRAIDAVPADQQRRQVVREQLWMDVRRWFAISLTMAIASSLASVCVLLVGFNFSATGGQGDPTPGPGLRNPSSSATRITSTP